ncbi:salicylate synthase [Vibrio hepatarius]|uniref:salicylate synthase n=1 Tax=Vibrio hepatarius TaxID=171383 RepID=UPI001C0817AA|nr:salicylate synthase [Vibrio hepatarius]MBU2898687.1 salicylate synthase [Vibrio hepatarius]
MVKPFDNQHKTITLEHQCDPLLLATTLINADFCHNYVVYEHHNEWAIGINKLACLTVDNQGTIVDFFGNTLKPEHGLICDAIYHATQALPWDRWRLFGRVDFEFSHFAHKIPQKDDLHTLLELFIAQHDIRITANRLVIRTTNDSILPIIRETIDKTKNSVPTNTTTAKLTQDDIIKNDNIRHNYQKIVESAVNDIRDNNYKKVILSRVATLPRSIDMCRSFILGRLNNTPARSFMLKLGEHEAFGFSPETVLEVDKQGYLSTQPLAGTRLLPSDPVEAERLKYELTTDPKEIAEHATSVKLAVEELEQVCNEKTVCVTEFMEVYQRGSVQHLASRVVGQLKHGKSAWNAFKILFPAITASGIPKREAIEAISRFEHTTRGLYSGSILIADHDGFFDAALVLRAAYKHQSKSRLQAGAGVISLSSPTREWQETCEKMSCVLDHLIFEDQLTTIDSLTSPQTQETLV